MVKDPYTPAVERLNVTPHDRNSLHYYTPYGAKIVDLKFRWCFDLGIYPRWVFRLAEHRVIA